MIYTLLGGPFAAFYICGSLAAVGVPLLVGLTLAVYLITDVDAGVLGTADMVAAGLATGIVGFFFLILFGMNYYRNLESYFCTFPWLSAVSASQRKIGERNYQLRCPFTGLRPGFRCPSCQCRVHETALHKADRCITLPIGETVLRWDLASTIVEREGDVDKDRVALDEALDFRGNFYSQAVSTCCIGCATWQKCFNLAPRTSLSLALTALVFAYIPWAFTSFLELMGRGGAIVKMVTGCIAVGFAAAALLVQIRALVRANHFLSRYSAVVPAMTPIKAMPEAGFWYKVVEQLFSSRWDPLV